ncbi:MAG: SDR family oxidoreductase [Rhodospirillales bacterium]|nr:SDR family oxidoreductase [Rhodospirillales bacterium]
MTPHLFCLGYGYSAQALAAMVMSEGWIVSGTSRSAEKRSAMQAAGVRAFQFDPTHPIADIATALATATGVLHSIAPGAEGDIVIDRLGAVIARLPTLRWLGYLSTTGVYGDTRGHLVDETATLSPTSERSRRRVQAERRWLAFGAQHGIAVHVFRLAGIYGPHRSAIDQVRKGDARRIVKPGHLFSRIHVDDIAQVLRASIDRPNAGRIYNLCDDEAASQADVVEYACALLGIDPPPPIAFADAEPALSPMARSFWNDNRRIDNRRIKQELGVVLRHPHYRSGLATIAAGPPSGIRPLP